MDAVLAHAFAGLLALVFLTAAAHKLRAPRAFASTLRAYEILPAALASAGAAALVACELLVGTALVLPDLRRLALAGALALLALYGAAIALNLARGRRDIDCGCAGPSARQPLSGWLLLRNAVLGAAAVAALLPVAPRALGLLDRFTVGATIAVLYLLYVATNALLAHLPRTRALA